MLRGNDIHNLVALLEARGVSLFHACQLVDFQSYLKLGGIPSRAFLQDSQAAFTQFQTDTIDQDNHVWDKVFVNLSDFGRIFARGGNGVPNPYGPIALQIRSTAFCEAEDVAVCLRSAGAVDFDREKEALQSVAEIDWLFQHESKVGFPLSTHVKFGTALQESYTNAVTPEISCTFATGYLPINHVIAVWVDPYFIGVRPLEAWVNELKSKNDAEFPVRVRACISERRRMYDEIANLLVESRCSLHDWCQDEKIDTGLGEWAQHLLSGQLEYQFNRFASYLREGTLLPILENALKPTDHKQ